MILMVFRFPSLSPATCFVQLRNGSLNWGKDAQEVAKLQGGMFSAISPLDVTAAGLKKLVASKLQRTAERFPLSRPLEGWRRAPFGELGHLGVVEVVDGWQTMGACYLGGRSTSSAATVTRPAAAATTTTMGSMIEPVGDAVYDPSFLLPLYAIAWTSGAFTDCSAFVKQCHFDVVVAALASRRVSVRRAAALVLGHFFTLLETATFREQPELYNLLFTLRNALSAVSVPRLSSVFTGFVISAAHVLLAPEHHLYGTLNKFLFLHATLDVADVPLFYQMLNSSAEHFRRDRMWMLGLLRRGVRDVLDHRVLKRRHTAEILLSFHDSSLSDAATRRAVLETLNDAVRASAVAHDLVRNYGLLAWLHGVVVACKREDNLEAAAQVAEAVWTTLASVSAEHPKPLLLAIPFALDEFRLLAGALLARLEWLTRPRTSGGGGGDAVAGELHEQQHRQDLGTARSRAFLVLRLASAVARALASPLLGGRGEDVGAAGRGRRLQVSGRMAASLADACHALSERESAHRNALEMQVADLLCSSVLVSNAPTERRLEFAVLTWLLIGGGGGHRTRDTDQHDTYDPHRRMRRQNSKLIEADNCESACHGHLCSRSGSRCYE